MRTIYTLLICLMIFGLVFSKSHAATSDPLTTVELETPVHFLAPDGSDLRVESGSYTIEPAEEWIRLISGARHDAVLIEATKGTHELELEQPMGLSVPGETEEEADLHHITLLLPDGHSLDASGSYSGIRHRGFLKNTFNNVKKKANRAYKKARSSAKKTVSKVKRKANEVKKQTAQAAREKIELAKKGAKERAQKAKKYGQQKVKQGVQWARNSALRAKRHVETTARKTASQVRNKIQKAKRIVSNKLGPWPRFSQLAIVAAQQEARAWLRQIYVDSTKCKVKAAALIGEPGVLKSRYSFQGKIAKALKAAGASQRIADGWDSAFKESWEYWAKRSRLVAAPYPGFDAWPGPKAGPAPNLPFPVGKGTPPHILLAMSSHMLSKKLLSKLGPHAKHQQVKNAVLAFATDLGQRFQSCMAGCMLTKVMGSGSVTSYAPPLVPVGPVWGTCKGGVLKNLVGFEGS